MTCAVFASAEPGAAQMNAGRRSSLTTDRSRNTPGGFPMGTVSVDMSMSLDGFVAGPDTDADHPLGVGGNRLHQWLFADPQDPRDTAVSRRTARVGRRRCARADNL